MKRDILEKKYVFLKIQLHLQILSKSSNQHTFLLVQHGLFNIPILKPMAPAYHNTITLDPYLLNSRSNVMCLLSLRVEVQLVPKSGAIVLSTRWESNVHFIMEVFLNGNLKCSFRFPYYLFLNILLFD